MINKIPNEKRYYFPVKWIFPNPDLHMVSAFCKKNFETGFHVQSFYEIVFITRGAGYHFIGNDTLKAEVGDIFVVPPGVRHAFRGGEGFDVHHFHFSPNFFEKYMSVLKDLPCFFSLFEAQGETLDKLIHNSEYTYKYIKLEKKEYNEMLQAFEDLIYYIYHNIPYCGFIAECKSLVIIYLLCREYEKQPASKLKDGNDDFFTLSLTTLQERYSDAHTLQELADIAKMSKTSYVKKFKSRTGMAPRQYLLVERIKHAKELLQSSNMTVAAIAEQVGFYDLSHFIKLFRQHTGLSPGEFRKSLLPNSNKN